MSGGDTSKKRILVVDDNVMSRTVIERRLSKDGYQVMIASTGLEALSLVEREPVDLIFLDLVMEGLSGMDVMKRLKDDDRFRDISVVVISGLEDADAIAEVKASGASDFLPKPVMAADLQRTVADILGGARAGGSSDSAIPVEPDVGASQVLEPAYIEQLISDYGKDTTAGFITQFEELAPAQKEAIASAQALSDLKAWNRAAHDLKSGARTLGLTQLAAACRDIESACKDGRTEDAAQASDALEAHFEEAMKGLREFAAGM